MSLPKRREVWTTVFVDQTSSSMISRIDATAWIVSDL
jgi:hypothetical protein